MYQRFLTPDSIVPDFSNPQSLNNYIYALGNPIKFVDPSGHCSGLPDDFGNPDIDCWSQLKYLEDYYSISLSGDWHLDEILQIQLGLQDIELGFGSQGLFTTVFYGTEMLRVRTTNPHLTARVASLDRITFWNNAFNHGEDATRWLTIHEFGHIWDALDLLKTSRQFERETGGKTSGCGILPEFISDSCSYDPGGVAVSVYAENDRREDWADAFAAALFRGNWNAVVSNSPHEIRADALSVSSDRIAFVESKITFLRDLQRFFDFFSFDICLP